MFKKLIACVLLLVHTHVVLAQTANVVESYVTTNNLLNNPGFNNNAAGWNSSVGIQPCSGDRGGAVCVSGQSLVFSYTNGYVTQTITLPKYYDLDFISSLRLNVQVANVSMNGPDQFGVYLSVYNNAGQVIASADYRASTKGLSNVALNISDSAVLNPGAKVEVKFYGRDLGFWAGNYGPAFSDPYLYMTYRQLPFCTAPATTTNTTSCNINEVGSVVTTTSWTCPAAFGAPVQSVSTTSTCAPAPPTCFATTESRQTGCPTNYTGAITQQRMSSCPSPYSQPIWSDWVTTVNTCTLNQATITNTQTTQQTTTPTMITPQTSVIQSFTTQTMTSTFTQPTTTSQQTTQTEAKQQTKGEQAAETIKSIPITPTILAALAAQAAQSIDRGYGGIGQDIQVALMAIQGANLRRYEAKELRDRTQWYQDRAVYQNQRVWNNPRHRNIETYDEKRWLEMKDQQWYKEE